MEMPPLPKGKYDWWDDYYDGLRLSEEPEDRYRQLGLYDEDQMRAYGAECARMAREEAAKKCESVAFDGCHEWRREAVEMCAAAIRSES